MKNFYEEGSFCSSRIGRCCLTIAAISSMLAAALLADRKACAVEITEWSGGAHAYPAMFNLEGQKLGNGEFTQQIENGLLHIKITYDLRDGRRIEERAAFRQRPELIQQEWSWRELKAGKLEREFKVHFGAKTATAQKRSKEGFDHWSEQIEVEPGRTFAGFGFTLALQNLRPRLVRGEVIELKAVGFMPKPRMVGVKISSQGVDRLEMAGRTMKGDRFLIRPEIPAVAKLFVRVSDTHIWLTNPPPAGFLRWEGPLVESSDPLVRVDLVTGAESGAAKPVPSTSHR
jgi:hypothetical protein